jgi:hypothetical protein
MMRTKLVFTSLVFVALLITTARTTRSQNAPPSASEAEHAKRSLAISFLRVINTAELEYKMKHGPYASKDVLLASEEFKRRENRIEQLAKAALSNGPEVLPGWSLRLNVTADGTAYDLLLEDTTDKTCAYAAVTDERGIIRESRPIGCAI